MPLDIILFVCDFSILLEMSRMFNMALTIENLEPVISNDKGVTRLIMEEWAHKIRSRMVFAFL